MKINKFTQIERRTYIDSSTNRRTQGMKEHEGLSLIWQRIWGNIVDIPLEGRIYHIDKSNLTDWLKAGGITDDEISQAITPQAWIALINKSMTNL